jgi:hypothetical protein
VGVGAHRFHRRCSTATPTRLLDARRDRDRCCLRRRCLSAWASNAL